MNEVSDRYNKIAVEEKNNKEINIHVSDSLLEESKKFYMENFADDIPVNDLPYDKPREKERKFIGNHISSVIDENLTKK